jgi:carbamoyl-phosphate synthase large subunit
VNDRPTVVITGSGTVTCQSVIKAFRSQNEMAVRVVTVDASDQVAGRYFSDAFYRVPSASAPDFVDSLLQICRAEGASLLIPIVDYEFKALSSAIDQFASIGCLAGMSDPEVISTVNDKLATYCFFIDHGFSTARTWSAEEARGLAARLPYPVFLKPAVDGRSSLDCHTVQNVADLDLYLSQVSQPLVQEFIDAPEYTADVLADWDSETLGIVVRERIETKGGVSYKGRTVDDPLLENEIVRMVRVLGIHGPANIQAFRRGTEIFFNEINPRFSGALALSLAAGLNSPLMLLKIALHLPVESVLGKTSVGLTMLRYWDEVFVDGASNPIYPDYKLEPERPDVRSDTSPDLAAV